MQFKSSAGSHVAIARVKDLDNMQTDLWANNDTQGVIWTNIVERTKAQEVLDGDADVTGPIFNL